MHQAILLMPVAPHSLFDRALVLSPDDQLKISVLPDCGASFAVDGNVSGKLELGDSITCTSAEKPALLVSFGRSNFHQALKEKIWSVRSVGRGTESQMSEVAKTTSSKDTRLLEMHVSNLGVIENASLIFFIRNDCFDWRNRSRQTLIVTALQLLTGQRADSGLIGPFGDEARVDARYIIGDDEIVISRAVPRDGRSRAYI